MRVRRRFLFPFLLVALLAVPGILSAPVSAQAPAQDLNSVLARLNVAAKKFKTTSANFVFDTEMSDPVPDSDIQKGVVYYERSGTSFRMAAHIHEHNGRPATNAYNFLNGVFSVYDGSTVHPYPAAKWESYLMLGFGASGTELDDKWEIKYLSNETIDGVNVAKLELVAKDPAVRKNMAKITIWVDPDRGVSLKQRFDQNAGTYRICTYTDIKTNQKLPSNAFDLK
jgi:outer membrane lipoprotein-sorting protein